MFCCSKPVAPTKSLFVRMPVWHRQAVFARFGWEYETAPQAAMNGRRMYQPRGRLLGGSSSVNAMIYMRGQPADYDHWRQLGNAGWELCRRAAHCSRRRSITSACTTNFTAATDRLTLPNGLTPIL